MRSVASVLKLAPGWILMRSQLQAGPRGHVSGQHDTRQARHAGVSRRGEMPNVLNISSYKKVGLFLFLRKASSRSRSLEIRNETRAVSEDQTV